MTKTLYPFVGTRFVIIIGIQSPSAMDCYVTSYKNCTLTTIIFLTMTWRSMQGKKEVQKDFLLKCQVIPNHLIHFTINRHWITVQCLVLCLKKSPNYCCINTFWSIMVLHIISIEKEKWEFTVLLTPQHTNAQVLLQVTT